MNSRALANKESQKKISGLVAILRRASQVPRYKIQVNHGGYVSLHFLCSRIINNPKDKIEYFTKEGIKKEEIVEFSKEEIQRLKIFREHYFEFCSGTNRIYDGKN